jgi:hypothetical protein
LYDATIEEDMADTLDQSIGRLPAAHTPADLNLLSIHAQKTGAVNDATDQCPPVLRNQGSYYHKVYSNYADWTGISAVVTLGQPVEDQSRKGDKGRSLDGFSTYLGGNSVKGNEVDAGLTWDMTLDKHGQKDSAHKAWRPFWRNGTWHNAAAEQRCEWQPGDQVKMSLNMVAPGKLELTISDLGAHPKRCFTTDFQTKGFSDLYKRYFKRVDSIDQVGRENKSVVPTNASVDGTNWQQTMLTKADGTTTALTNSNSKVTSQPNMFRPQCRQRSATKAARKWMCLGQRSRIKKRRHLW